MYEPLRHPLFLYFRSFILYFYCCHTCTEQLISKAKSASDISYSQLIIIKNMGKIKGKKASFVSMV